MATPYKPTREERIEELKRYVLPAIGALIVLAVGAWVVWHQFLRGPAQPGKSVVSAAVASPEVLAAVARISTEVDELEKRTRVLELTAAEPAERDSALTAAIEKQREVLKLGPGVGEEQRARLRRLETARATLRAQVATTRSAALESEARSLLGNGRRDDAITMLREALRLQQEADANAPADGPRNLPREAQLAATITDLEAEPLHEKAVAARQRGTEAMSVQKDEAAALAAFQEGRDAQAELNRKFPTSRYADIPAVDALDTTIASIGGSGLAGAVTAHAQEASEAMAAGRLEAAAIAYEKAADAQRELNARFPQSSLVSQAKLEDFTLQRETVLSQAAVERLKALDQEAAELRGNRRNAEAAQKVAEAAELLDATTAKFPRSRALDPVLRKRLDYLMLRRDDIDTLQKEVWSQLLPLSGGGSWMLRTEVTQDLYQRVMNRNPSRNVGRGLPVDSVSWNDAQEFCERLSWVMGNTVRLPTEEEFRAALAGAGPTGWSAENSGNQSHEPAQLAPSEGGFYDLRGNLAEWLQSISQKVETAPIGGGSFLDDEADLPRTSPVLADRRDRRRHIGFRVVVELPR